MDNTFLITLVFIAEIIGFGVVVALLARRGKSEASGEVDAALQQQATAIERLDQLMRAESSSNRREMGEALKGVADSLDRRLAHQLSLQQDGLRGVSKKVEELTQSNDAKLERVRTTVDERLQSLQKDNAEKLEVMRATVDEKLHATLEKRLGESFKLVSDRLESVHKGLGEMQTLASGVGDLKKVLTNVKTRGTWGEVQLGSLLEQIMTSGQYDKNVAVKKRSAERVEFAIKLPNGPDENTPLWLPIDAKFPVEDYQRLMAAREAGEVELTEVISRELVNRIKSEAKDIRTKYIAPPETTDFGILYLPTEGLYAEITQRAGLQEALQKDYRVMVAGPNTIAALLNSLQMGFRTLAIEKRSSEVWQILGSVKNEFGKFGDLLEKTHKKLQEASNTIESAATKSRTIERKLDKVGDLPETVAPQLIPDSLTPPEE